MRFRTQLFCHLVQRASIAIARVVVVVILDQFEFNLSKKLFFVRPCLKKVDVVLWSARLALMPVFSLLLSSLTSSALPRGCYMREDEKLFQLSNSCSFRVTCQVHADKMSNTNRLRNHRNNNNKQQHIRSKVREENHKRIRVCLFAEFERSYH